MIRAAAFVAGAALILALNGCAQPPGPPPPSGPPPGAFANPPPPPPPPPPPMAAPPGPRAGPSMRYSAVPKPRCQIKTKKIPTKSASGQSVVRVQKYKVCR